MNTAVIKERLHEYIETADSTHLTAIYVLLEKELSAPVSYDADTLTMLYNRVEADLAKRSKSYTIEEAFAIVRSKKSA